MLGTLRSRWQELRASFWFYPGLIAAAFIGLSVLLIRVDRTSGPNGIDWAFSGDAEAARGILSTIAGSLITVAGLSFSITIVTLQLVSGQFTPRALRSFLSDRVNQAVAGAFVGIFAYCLVTLRSIRAEDTDGTNGFVPALTVTAAILLALLALALLLLFIHHMGQLIQVSNIAARIARQTLRAVGRLYPTELGEQDESAAAATLAAWRSSGPPDVVLADRPGYVRRIDDDRVDAALPDGARIHLSVRPGDFVTETTRVVEVWPGGILDEQSHAALQRAIEVESERDIEQDAGFGIRQLSDIGMRALSPGVNDPTTAVTCIGYLQAVLEQLAAREFPAQSRRLGKRKLELITARTSFGEHAEAAYDELGRYAAENPRVVAALLRSLAAVAGAARAAHAGDRVETIAVIARDAGALGLEQAGTESQRARIAELLQEFESAATRTG